MVKMRIFGVIPAAILAAACGGSSAPANTFSAALNGTSEVPPTTSSGTGTAAYTLSGTTMTYTITYTGLTGKPVASHIHVGSTTAAGPVVLPFTLPTTLTGGSGTFSGSFTTADIKQPPVAGVASLDDLLFQMRNGNTYTNVHTAANGGGEIRGQNH